MPEPKDILLLMSRVARDPGRDLSTTALARRSGWSDGHLHRAFRRIALETPKAWITRVRLARAIGGLRTGAPIARVAEDAGFRSHEVLTRTFRRELGTTPSTVRARQPDAADAHAACLCLYHLPIRPRRTPMPTDPVTVITRDPQPVLFIRRRVRPEELQPALAACLPAVFRLSQERGWPLVGPPFTRYVEMSRGHFTIECGFPVGDGALGEGEIEAGTLPGGEIAMAVHRGPYEALGDTHSALEAWAAAAGRSAGAPWESYVTDPGELPDPADWRTEVLLPLG